MKESTLLRIARTSSVGKVSLQYGDELIKFNLTKEVKIDPETIEDELLNQPTYYAFLIMLQSKLIRKFKDQEVEVRKIYAKLFEGNKDEGMANDLAKETAIANEKYTSAQKLLNEYEQNMNDIIGCVKSFEMRKDLLQTLSANIRKERL